MKALIANKSPIAKTTFTLATCLLFACTAALKANDQAADKARSADSRNLQSDKSTSSQSSESQGGTSKSTSSDAGGASSLSNPDEKFIREAAIGSKMEIKMGKLGTEKAQNAQVKQFAQRLIDDHTKAGTELKQLASSKGITLPQDDTASSSSSSSDRTQVREKPDASADHSEHGQHQAQMKKLEQLSGAEFDREFVKMAVADHQKDVKEFEKQAQKSSDAEIKAFAQKTAPILREHLQQAKSLESQVGASSTGQGSPDSDSSSTSGADKSDSDSKKSGTDTK